MTPLKFNGRHTPIGISAQSQGSCHRFIPGDFIARGFLPHQSGHEIGDRPVAMVLIGGLGCLVAGVLPSQTFTLGGTGDDCAALLIKSTTLIKIVFRYIGSFPHFPSR